MNILLAYLLIGEIPAVAFWMWAQHYCWRFVGKVEPNWRDLTWVVGVQVLWPIAVLCSWLPYLLWRRAMEREICLCGHSRGQHAEPNDYWTGNVESCTHSMRSAAFLVNGEGPEFIRCGCRKFNKPNVRKRR